LPKRIPWIDESNALRRRLHKPPFKRKVFLITPQALLDFQWRHLPRQEQAAEVADEDVGVRTIMQPFPSRFWRIGVSYSAPGNSIGPIALSLNGVGQHHSCTDIDFLRLYLCRSYQTVATRCRGNAEACGGRRFQIDA
jgi:hypothetical protein